MGQAKNKQVECPAVGRRIKPAECGENRISNYACPSDCPHNPWNVGNYDRTADIFERFRDKSFSRFKAELAGKMGYAAPPPFNENTDEFTILEWFSNKFYREKDKQGRTFKQRWADARYDGLNNDQRILFEAESRMRAALLEVRQVLDDRSCLVVDLLDTEGQPFIIVDRALTERACRFSTYFGIIYDLPHYTRVHSAGCPIPDVTGLGMRDVFVEVCTHLGTPQDAEEMREWLNLHVLQVVDSLLAVAKARHEAMLRSIDAIYTKSIYELACTPKKFIQILKKQADMDPEDVMSDDAEAGFDAEWVCLAEESPTGHGQILVGRILLHRDGYIQLESSSLQRIAQLKARVEEIFGVMIRFCRERMDDLGAQLIEKRALHYDPALVPERLMEHTAQFDTSTSRIPIPDNLSMEELEEHMEQEFMKSFLENEVPALDGLTPRQAAADPAMRLRLIDLVKSHVRSHDEKCLQSGRPCNINWMLEELGLDEINEPSPPLRLAPPDEWDEFDEDDKDDPLDGLMMEPDQIEERNRELDELGNEYLVKCFKKAYPSAMKILSKMIDELDLGYAKHGLLELAARVCFVQMDPSPTLNDRFSEDLLSHHLSMSLEYIEERDSEGLIQSLSQPAIADIVTDGLDDVLRMGKNDQAFANCFIFLVSLSEAIDEMVCGMMTGFFEGLDENQ